jgi:hypothetical protein
VLSASTSEVYLPSKSPVSESSPTRSVDETGRWAYAASKIACERMLDEAQLWPRERAPLHLRFFKRSSGPGQDSKQGMMLPTFVEHALANRPIPVHGDGSQVRTLAHVDDVARTLCELIELETLPGGPLNVGGTARASVLEIAAVRARAFRKQRGHRARRSTSRARPRLRGHRVARARSRAAARARRARASQKLEEIVKDTLERHEVPRPRGNSCGIARVLTRLNLGGPARPVARVRPAARCRWVTKCACTPARRARAKAISTTSSSRADCASSAFPGLAAASRSPVTCARCTRCARACARSNRTSCTRTRRKPARVGRRAARPLANRGARAHVPRSTCSRAILARRFSKGLVALERRLARETDRIVAVSHATADDLLRLGVVADEKKLVVVPPGIELDPFLELRGRDGALRARDRRERARFRRRRDRPARARQTSEWALDVFALLANAYPKLHLVFVGDGELRGRRRAPHPRAAERAATPRAPRRRAHRHATVLADLDLVLLTSRSEGLPVALIEAAAAGKPVVSTNVGGVSEIVVTERTGWLGESVDELAFGMAQFLDNPGGLCGARRRARVCA